MGEAHALVGLRPRQAQLLCLSVTWAEHRLLSPGWMAPICQPWQRELAGLCACSGQTLTLELILSRGVHLFSGKLEATIYY